MASMEASYGSAQSPSADVTYKTQLIAVCGRTVKRLLTKEDIVYSTEKFGDQFQATVRLNCLGGGEFAGELCSTVKAAEHAAAYQALLAHGAISEQPPKADTLRSRGTRARKGPVPAMLSGAQPSSSAAAGRTDGLPGNAKAQLSSFCSKWIGRALTSEDVVYASSQYGEKFQATVQLNCLEGRKRFAGELMPSTKAAEQSAAHQALAAYASDVAQVLTQGKLNPRRRRKAIDLTGEFSNPKTELNGFCQLICNKPMSKEDIVYTTIQHGSSYQSTVKLNCKGGLEIAGELQPNSKAAEFAAAKQALLHHASEIEELNEGAVTFTEEDRIVKSESTKDAGEQRTAFVSKSFLQALASRLLHRKVLPQDIVYSLEKLENGHYQGTVKVSDLPAPWGEKAWRGEACASKKAAEHAAADALLEAMTADPEIGTFVQELMDQGHTGRSKGWAGRPERQSGPDLPREPLAGSVRGTVLEWRGSYGWLDPLVPVVHEQADRHGGKIYVHKKDLPPGVESLSPGSEVSFEVYVDPSGLGAASVTVK